MRSLILIPIAFAALYFLISPVLFGTAQRQIERRLTLATKSALRVRLDEALKQNQIQDLDVSFDGLEGQVKGIIASDDTKSVQELTQTTIEEIVSGKFGDLKGRVMRLENLIRKPARVRLYEAPEGPLVIEGNLHDESTLQSYLSKIQGMPGREVRNEILVSPTVQEAPPWEENLGPFLRSFLIKVRNPHLNVFSDQKVWLEGQVDSEAERSELIEQAHAAFPNWPKAFETDMLVVLPDDKPAMVFLKRKGETLHLSGVLPSEDASKALVQAAKTALPDATIEDHLTVNAALQEPTWLPNLMGFFTEALAFPDLELDMVAKTTKIFATAPDLATKEHLLGQAQQLFPDHVISDAIKLASDATPTPITPPATSIPSTDRDRDRDTSRPSPTLKALVDSTDIYFGTGSAAVTSEELTKLEALAKGLSSEPKVHLTILGFADARGSADANLRLSRNRCQSVKAALLALGVTQDRLTLSEQGATASTPTTPNEQNDRRVEFEIRKEPS